MNKLLKLGTTSTLSLLLCTSVAKAEGLNHTRPHKPLSVEIPTERKVDFFVSKRESNLGLSADSQKAVLEQLNNSIISNQENSIGNFFPADAPLVALINTKTEIWESLNRFQLFNLVQQNILQFLPKGANLDYFKEIQSFIGDEAAIGFMPKVGNIRVTLRSNFVAIAPITNETGLKSFLDTLVKDKQRVKVREYQGATIFEIITPPANIPIPTSTSKKQPTSDDNYLAVTTFPGYVALGLSPKSIEQLIENKTGNQLTITKNPQFQAFTQQNRDGVLFSMYQNPGKYLALIKDFANDPNLPVPLPALQALKPEQFEKYASINSTIRLQPEGLRFQSQTFLSKSETANIKSVNKQEQSIISKMPAATYSASTGSNISLQWQTIVSLLSTTSEFKKGLADFRNFVKSSTDLDLDRDIIGWMDGEYGFFMFPTKGGLFNSIMPKSNLGIGLVVKTSNRSAAEKTLDKFKQLLKNIGVGEIVVKNSDIKGQSVTSWDSKVASTSLFAYSWTDENTLLFTTGLGAINDLVPKPQVPLSSTYNFSTATNSLPYPNQGYFYVNMGSSLSWIYGFIPQEYQNNQFVKGFKQGMGSVYSLSATTSKTTEQEQFDMLMVLAPTRTK